MDKKRFLFVSITGLIGDIAWQCVKEGHEVRLYIEDESEREIADGFVPKTDNWASLIDWAEVIVFDDTLGQGGKAEELRKAGKKVVGGTAYTDRLEDDRGFGQEEMKSLGIPIISYVDFNDFDEAIDYIQKNPAEYVIKPTGGAGGVRRLLFVGEESDGKDVIQILEAYKKIWAERLKAFQLQKRIMGVEVGVGAFFNGQKFLSPININFEHKRMFPGNLGPQTGEMGTSMFWSEPNKLFNMTLKKFETKLAEEGYVGYIDLNCMVNNNGIYPLEFTSRFGYPAIMIQQEGIITPISELLFNLANGEDIKFKTKRGFQVGVRLCVPPYPFDDEETFLTYSKDQIIIFKKPTREGVHIEDCKLVNEQWIVCGSAGVVLTVIGSGTTMKQAQAQVYNRVKNILMPNMFYRNDIGDRWFEDSDKLHNWGYLREQ